MTRSPIGSSVPPLYLAVFAITTILGMTLVAGPLQMAIYVNAATANLVVNSKDSSGNTITGYYTTVSQSGTVKATGYTPASFTLAAGTYSVSVSDYGGYYFNHWSDGSTSRSHSVTLTTTGVVTLTAIYSKSSGSTTASYAIKTKYTDGTSFTGALITLKQNGVKVASKYSPAYFTLNVGQTYTASPSDTSFAKFSKWSDGSTTRDKTFTVVAAGNTLYAVYTRVADFKISASPTTLSVSAGNSGSSTVTLTSVNSFASSVALSVSPSISGVTTSITPTSQTLASGGTTSSTLKISTTSSATPGTYKINVKGTSGTTSHSTTVTLTITASSSTGCPGTAAGANTVTVVTCSLDGTKTLTGFYTNLRLNGNIIADGYTPKTFTMTPGNTYVVVLYWCCDQYFRHYSDGTLTRYYVVTPGSSGILVKGMYESVPASQAAKLNVIAKDTNGNVIGGTTTNPDGSISTQPGMWMWLTPPGSSTPYTGAYTGSSSTPFTIFNGKTYTLTMSSFDKYQFDHWQDNGSTNPTRAFTMNGDSVNNVAIYRIVSTATAASASTATASSESSSSMDPPPFIDVDHPK
jgi:hypothetical protein